MEFKLTIVNPEKFIYEDEKVNFVVLPARMGEMGVFKRHTPLISSLKEGKIKIKKTTGETEEFYINSGFVEILPGKITVLTGFNKPEAEQKNES